MASRGKALLFVVIILHSTGIFSFAIIGDTLFQEQNLTRWEKLTSTSEVHELFFRSISYDISKIRRYLVLSASGRVPHWIGNPLEAHESVGKLTIDDYGNFKILYDRGVSDSLIIYSSEATEKISASATLLNNGNLVLREMNSDGSVKRVLWQSFDDPLYVLLPEMRLGFNKATGEIWNLTSWIGPNTPVLGSFTLGMDPNNAKQLVIWSRRKVYWTSGPLNDGSFSNLKTTFGRYNFFFSYFSDENETYVTYSTNSAEAPFIMLNSLGRLIGQASISCNGHDNPALVGGCVPLRPPHFRNPETNVSMEDFKYGNISQEGHKSQETENLSLYDCGVMCLNNCSCVAYAATTRDGTGCEMWSNETQFAHFVESSLGRPIYFISDNPKGKSKDIKHTQRRKLLVAVMIGGALMILIIASFICRVLQRKRRIKAVERLHQKKLLYEIGDISISSVVDSRRKKCSRSERTSHEIHVFSFESIAMATDNFSSANKLGQGGYGPIYKAISGWL